MPLDKRKEQEFEFLLSQFSRFIHIHIHKYNLYKFGVDPEDISQEVQIKLWKLLNSEKNITSYASYIKKIVNSSVIDQFRKLKREEGIYDLERQKKIAEQDTLNGSNIRYYEYLKEAVGKAVESLLDSRRQVVKLHLLNLSLEEIAEYLKWSQDKTRNLLYRGLADLKKILKEMDVDYADK